MTFMRVTRDQRGYETTFLLHTRRPGEEPRVLYWYRTAPGVRVGRRALDEEAIRVLEEQHPDVEFDWPQLLEDAESAPPEVERRPERPRRKRPQTEADAEPSASGRVAAPTASASAARVDEPRELRRDLAGAASGSVGGPSAPASARVDEPRELRRDLAEAASGRVGGSSAPARPGSLLDQLVGREIAARLRARYLEISARIAEQPDADAKTAWQQRADALDPDRWESAEAILQGMQHADRLFDELKRELPV